MTRRQFFAALLAPFLVRFARWFRPAPAAAPYTVGPVTTLTTADFAGGLRLGDTFTIAGYYATNPRTLQPTSILKEFIVSAVDERRRSITFFPAAITDGQYKTVHKAAA